MLRPQLNRERPSLTVQEDGWASATVWTGAENLALSGFEPRNVQPVGSRYTDYATPPQHVYYRLTYLFIERLHSLLNNRQRISSDSSVLVVCANDRDSEHSLS